MKIYIWVFFENLSRKFKIRWNLTKITGRPTLREDLCMFMITSLWILLKMIIVTDTSCRENQQTHFMFNNFPSKIVSFVRSSSSSIGTTAHCGLWPVEQRPSIFSYLPPTLSIFSLPSLEDLFLLPLSIFSWVFPFFSSLPFLEWRSFWASYPPPFSLGELTSLSFAILSILLYFLLCSFLLVLDSSFYEIMWKNTV